ncbi:MAG: hypothetical protein ACHQRM_05865 [Bacteroidia bacterium]
MYRLIHGGSHLSGGILTLVTCGIGSGVFTYRFPLYATICLGAGASSDTEDKFTLAIGSGVSLKGASFFDTYSYQFIQAYPAMLFELGYDVWMLRLEFAPGKRHVVFNHDSYADFNGFSATWTYYFN